MASISHTNPVSPQFGCHAANAADLFELHAKDAEGCDDSKFKVVKTVWMKQNDIDDEQDAENENTLYDQVRDERDIPEIFTTAADCNAHAAIALYSYLRDTCSEWEAQGVKMNTRSSACGATLGSGCVEYRYDDRALLKSGDDIDLVAIFYGVTCEDATKDE